MSVLPFHPEPSSARTLHGSGLQAPGSGYQAPGSGPQTGSVTLVGAGPGHPDHLTLRGLRALQQADVILYDALLDPAFLELFPPSARAIHVGKRCGDHALRQEEINALLVAEARAGHRVVRLKGGDPFVFGRGGEEALAVRAAGFACDVVPGLSALNGVAAAAGIPLTHRGLSKELRVIEGHTERDWREFAAYAGTLAIFMGARALPEIARALLAAGADPARPVALVEHGCTGRQTVSLGDLTDAAQMRMMPRTDGPGLVLMGPTIPLHDLLSTPLDYGLPHVPAPSPLPQPRWPARAAGRRRDRRAG